MGNTLSSHRSIHSNGTAEKSGGDKGARAKICVNRGANYSHKVMPYPTYKVNNLE